MRHLHAHPISALLAGLYLLLTIGVGIYALTCASQFCSLILVVPLTPWPQLFSALPFEVPQLFLPIAVLLNVGLLTLIGFWLERLLGWDS